MSTATLDSSVVYFNTRVRGMKSRLFPRQRFEEFLAQHSIAYLRDALLESDYRVELAEALSRYEDAEALESAVSRNLSSTFRTLRKGVTGDYGQAIALFLERWDLTAAKSVLRVKHAGVESGIEAYVVPGPSLTEPVLEHLLRQLDVEQMVACMTPFVPELCRGLGRTLAAYREHHDVARLEEALDRNYFAALFERLPSLAEEHRDVLADYARREIDRINLHRLFLSLRTEADRATLRERLIPGGYIRPERILAWVNVGDAVAAFEALGNTRYAGLVEAMLPYVQQGRFAAAERLLEGLMLRTLHTASRANVFSLAVVIEYAWLKYNEVLNLRVLVRGLVDPVPSGALREALVFV